MKPFSLIKKYTIFSYLILTFILSLSGIVIVSFFTGMPTPSKKFEAIALIAMLPLVLGPTIVSVFMLLLLIFESICNIY